MLQGNHHGNWRFYYICIDAYLDRIAYDAKISLKFDDKREMNEPSFMLFTQCIPLPLYRTYKTILYSNSMEWLYFCFELSIEIDIDK